MDHFSFCLAMQAASSAFAEAVKEVYEPAWSEREKLVNLYDVCTLRMIGFTLIFDQLAWCSSCMYCQALCSLFWILDSHD